MQIIEQNENAITLLTGARIPKMLWWLPFVGILMSWGIRGLILRTNIVENVAIILGIFSIAIGFTSILVLLFLLIESVANPITTCTLDKNSRIITVVREVVWRLWYPQAEEYSLNEVTTVTLGQTENKAFLGLSLKSTNRVRLRTEAIQKNNSLSEIAESVSQFLGVPLQLEIGGQQVVKYPRATISTYPMLCPVCAGQLPPIQEEMVQITCEYCGTTALLKWENDRIAIHPASSTKLFGNR